MQYFIQRDGQQYGPYTLADLQHYVQAGNVALNDMARSEAMEEWMPVSEVIGTIQASDPVDVSGGVVNAEIFTREETPIPSKALGMPWYVLLILNYLTRQMTAVVWGIFQALYARELDKKSLALVYQCISVCFLIAVAVLASQSPSVTVTFIGVLAYVVFYQIANFSVRSSLLWYYNRKENIRLELGAFMTFLFGPVYLQYHLNEIRKRKLKTISNL